MIISYGFVNLFSNDFFCLNFWAVFCLNLFSLNSITVLPNTLKAECLKRLILRSFQFVKRDLRKFKGHNPY